MKPRINDIPTRVDPQTRSVTGAGLLAGPLPIFPTKIAQPCGVFKKFPVQ